MARYIDADKMVSKDNAYTTFPHDLAGCDDNDLVRWINEQPTADVVGVTRCKDCKYFPFEICINDFGMNFCRGDDFCSYGERKE